MRKSQCHYQSIHRNKKDQERQKKKYISSWAQSHSQLQTLQVSPAFQLRSKVAFGELNAVNRLVARLAVHQKLLEWANCAGKWGALECSNGDPFLVRVYYRSVFNTSVLAIGDDLMRSKNLLLHIYTNS
uniref:Uncharacterized protein n=1 Tax=Oryza brachyantha TaxID=4533 RepID=J3N4U7_ORYBR